MKNFAIALSVLTLAACGGGGGDDAPAAAAAAAATPLAEGVYGGTLTGSASSAFQMLVLENGEFWTMYGISTSTAFAVEGFVQGSGTSNDGTFTSTDIKDFGFSPAEAETLSATFNATEQTISGTVSAPAGPVTFNGGPIAGSLYNYSTPASLATISGAWSTTALTGEGVALNIASNGAFTAVFTHGCNLTGTATPRASGKNVFDVALTFGAAPCPRPGQAESGIAVAYPLANGQTQLVVSTVDGTRSFGTAAFGTR